MKKLINKTIKTKNVLKFLGEWLFSSLGAIIFFLVGAYNNIIPLVFELLIMFIAYIMFDIAYWFKYKLDSYEKINK